MPIYEYRCNKCNAVNEFLVGVTAESSALVCPACGSAELTKLFSVSAVSSRSSGTDAPCADRCAQEKGGAIPPCMNGGGCCCG